MISFMGLVGWLVHEGVRSGPSSKSSPDQELIVQPWLFVQCFFKIKIRPVVRTLTRASRDLCGQNCASNQLSIELSAAYE
jgi:hypothetical protein